MIVFHNDHLVAPKLCEILYKTIPIGIHVPVVFVPHTKRYKTHGSCHGDSIEIFLQGIYYRNKPNEFNIWRQLLFVCYHEFGHIATRHKRDFINQGMYDSLGREFRYVENLANVWADIAIEKLAECDKRIYQPKRLGQYFDGRIVKYKKAWRELSSTDERPNHHIVSGIRRYKSGGQFTTGEVAWHIGAILKQYNNGFLVASRPKYSIIRKLAFDLAYPYIDQAGRNHMLFAYGDLPEIKRRYERHKALIN